jgi:hypothetical protein
LLEDGAFADGPGAGSATKAAFAASKKKARPTAAMRVLLRMVIDRA